ncbi:MAG: glycine--tRNA ligase [Methanocalculaceae archaeon]|jgi:glycyl-tRNA synthetase|nr:glycine--tRNA ligase [Methanocalculaceae archaeon]
MAEKEDTYEKVTELARRRGFIWPSSEIYGSVAGFTDYGPLGAMMKRRIENIWRRFYVVQEGYYEIECPTIGIEPIFVASGHVGGFSDKMFQCPYCQEFLRADHVAEAFGIPHAGTISKGDLHAALISKECPVCGNVLGPVEVFDFNLMFTTSIGPGGQRKGYLRPETAQGMFVDFPRLLRFYRDHLPFGVVQIGKSYRNEISPRQGMIRLREFTQAEAEIFVHPEAKDHPFFARYANYSMPLCGISQQEVDAPAVVKMMRQAVDEGIIANEYVAYYVAMTHDILCTIGLNPEKIRFRQHMPDERAHYAADCWDAEAFSDRFGWVEIVGIADRTDYDLAAHSRVSGKKMTVFVQYPEAKKVHRKVISPDYGKMGPMFRGKTKAIAELMATTEPLADGLHLTTDGDEIIVPSEMYTMIDEIVDVFGEDVMPHVIEPSYGVDRMSYMVLEHAYAEDEVDGEMRVIMRFKPCVAPVQAAVLPLMARDGLDEIAHELVAELQNEGIQTEYDDAGAIGRRYRRQDEIGTPVCITIDYDTKEDVAATLRDRDSMQQVRLPLADIPRAVSLLMKGKKTFGQLA